MLLNCIWLYCIVLHAISLYCMVLHSITRGCTARMDKVQTLIKWFENHAVWTSSWYISIIALYMWYHYFIRTIVVCSRLQLRHAIPLRFFSLDMTRHLMVFLRITEKYLRNAKISNRQLQLNNKIICTSAVLLLFWLGKTWCTGRTSPASRRPPCPRSTWEAGA